ncbi:MAG: mechanosensitive ion channel family protein [Alphaproteobacteria bacterium]
MKKIFLITLCALMFSLESPAASSVAGMLKSGADEVVSAGSSLNKFSDYLSKNFNESFSSVRHIFQYFDTETASIAPDEGSWGILIAQFIKTLLVLFLSIGGFFVLQRFIFFVWIHHPSQKGYSISKGDRILFYVAPWIVFLLLGNFFANLFSLFPVLHSALIKTFFIFATIFPIKQIAFLFYKVDQKNLDVKSRKKLRMVAPPFIYRWVIYLFSLGLICAGLILVSAFFMDFLIDHKGDVGPLIYNHLHHPSIIFPGQLVFYFYMVSLFLFVLSLELFSEENKKILPDKKLHVFAHYWKHYGKYWNHLARWGILCSFFIWFGVEVELVPSKFLDILLGVDFLLILLSSRAVTTNVLGYVSVRLTEKILSSKMIDILDCRKFFRLVGYSIYYFLSFYCLMSLWGFDKATESIEHICYILFEKIFFISLIIFITFSVRNFFLSIIRKILNSRTEKEIALRSGNRLYTFLTVFEALLPTFLWIPSLSIILLLFGLSGTIILMVFAGLGAVLVWVGQNVMQDMMKGIIYMMEDIVVIGEEVTINDHTSGRIERISLHSISVRDFNGLLHTYSFGKIDSIASSEWKFVNLVLDVIIDYKSDLEKAMELMRKVILDMKKDHEDQNLLQENTLEVYVEDFIQYGVHVKARIKMIPGARKTLKTVFYRRLKQAFDKNKIQIGIVDPTVTLNP